MKPFWFVGTCVLAVLLLTYLLVEAVDVTILSDPEPTLAGAGAAGAVIGVGLLVADALLPVPASLVMISLGALYGAAWGIALSFVGRFGMAVVGFELGRRGGPVLERAMPSFDRQHAQELVNRWGAFAIILSRPIPLLAETVVLLAGASGLRRRVALAAAFVGSIPEAVAYGLTGAFAASFRNGALVWCAFLVLALLFRLIEMRQREKSQTRTPTSAASTRTTGT